MRFFHYSQNNSGGRFTGEYHHIIVQAPSADVANQIAEDSTDIYFYGCAKGIDCDCCGDRWYEAWSDNGDDLPMIYGTPADEYSDAMFGGKVLVVYANGDRKEYGEEFK